MIGMPIKPPSRKRVQDGTRCQVHEDHGHANPVYLTEHFIFPQVLQVMSLGEVKDRRTAWICATGADNVMAMIQWVLEATPDGHQFRGTIPWTHKPFDVDPAEVLLAEKGLRRYFSALDGLADLRSKGAWAVHPNDWRCPVCGEGMTFTSAGGNNNWTHKCAVRSTKYEPALPTS